MKRQQAVAVGKRLLGYKDNFFMTFESEADLMKYVADHNIQLPPFDRPLRSKRWLNSKPTNEPAGGYLPDGRRIGNGVTWDEATQTWVGTNHPEKQPA